jgi:hypothetical protein
MYLLPVERLYREIATPKLSPPKPTQTSTEPKQITLSMADVQAILRRSRSASPEELQYILDHSQDYGLSDWERNRISVDVTVAMAARARGMSGRPDNPAAEFLSKVMGLSETPFGFIERAWVSEHMRSGSQAISRCRTHRPPLCECWSSSRAILWQARASGDKTPTAWAAARVYEFLEDLELASRPEPGESHL